MIDLIQRIERLEDALELIESQADGHRASTAYNDGENIALVNIRTIARITLKETREALFKATDDGVQVKALQAATDGTMSMDIENVRS